MHIKLQSSDSNLYPLVAKVPTVNIDFLGAALINQVVAQQVKRKAWFTAQYGKLKQALK